MQHTVVCVYVAPALELREIAPNQQTITQPQRTQQTPSAPESHAPRLSGAATPLDDKGDHPFVAIVHHLFNRFSQTFTRAWWNGIGFKADAFFHHFMQCRTK